MRRLWITDWHGCHDTPASMLSYIGNWELRRLSCVCQNR